MSEGDIQRWSREVAEDPGAPSFVRLARAYRKQGRTAVAREVVERGLSQHPEHLEGHCLLGLLHLDEGDHEGARGAWETALRLDHESFSALRGLGFLALERHDLLAARRYLDSAARIRPADPAVYEARRLVDQRAASAEREAASAGSPGAGPVDPGRLFQPLRGEPTFDGALLLDRQGRPLAGGLDGEEDATGEVLGGMMAAVADEARRAADLLGIGTWERVLLEAEKAMVDVSALTDEASVVVVTRPGTPLGWTLRLAGRARDVAQRFLEVAP